jgi:hypothetical protein
MMVQKFFLLTLSAVLKANKTQSPEDVSISSDDMENMISQLSLRVSVSNLYNHVFPTCANA